MRMKASHGEYQLLAEFCPKVRILELEWFNETVEDMVSILRLFDRRCLEKIEIRLYHLYISKKSDSVRDAFKKHAYIVELSEKCIMSIY